MVICGDFAFSPAVRVSVCVANRTLLFKKKKKISFLFFSLLQVLYNNWTGSALAWSVRALDLGDDLYSVLDLGDDLYSVSGDQ